jgi:membrane fusion protein, multidrug efflux system
MKHKVVSIFIAVLIVAGSCKQDQQAQLSKLRKQHDEISDKIKKLEDDIAAKDTTEKTGVRVAVSELKPSVFDHYIEVQGKVDGDQNVNVYAEGAGGMISQIYVKEGQNVSGGQMLARLDDKLYQESLKSLQANLEYVTAMYNKQKSLWDQKIGSEVQFLDIKSKKESLESNVAALKEQINMCYVKAPVSGTVEDIPVKIGQLVGPGIIAFRVVNLASLKIVADLAEAYTSHVNIGDKVSVFLPDLNKEAEGKIDYCSKFINPTNRTFQVGIRLVSFDNNLKANMIATLKINDYKAPKALVVSINMVQTDQSGSYVLVAEKNSKDAKAKRIPVVVGSTYKGDAEIISGLKPGDLVITAGYLDLENGQAINY